MPPMPVAREFRELLLAAARRPHADPQQLAALAACISDWDSVLQLAHEHRVLPMLAERLGETTAVPDAVHHKLRAAFECNAMQNLLNAAELLAVLQAFDQAGIPLLPFKGLVLGSAVYGDLTTRPAGDIDVLIHPSHMVPAAALLRARGYSLHTPTYNDGTPAIAEYCDNFNRASDGMILEMTGEWSSSTSTAIVITSASTGLGPPTELCFSPEPPCPPWAPSAICLCSACTEASISGPG